MFFVVVVLNDRIHCFSVFSAVDLAVIEENAYLFFLHMEAHSGDVGSHNCPQLSSLSSISCSGENNTHFQSEYIQVFRGCCGLTNKEDAVGMVVMG